MKFYSFVSIATAVLAPIFFTSNFLGVTAQNEEPGTIVDIAVGDERFSTLVTALTAANLTEALSGPGPFTVFAPSDEVFAGLPAGLLDDLLADPSGALTDVLLYHVASGSVTSGDLSDGMTFPSLLEGKNLTITIEPSTPSNTVKVNDIPVVTADIIASNGVIHVIGGVLIPPAPLDIVDIALADPENFSTLVTAVTAAKLVDTLKGDGPFTVFAPTNVAFGALPEGTIESLLADPEGDLKDILLYHVVAGNYNAASITDGLTLTTVLEEEIKFSIRDDGVYVNEAKVVIADVEASNGVIHVIDQVLIPPEEEATSGAAADGAGSLTMMMAASLVVVSFYL